MKTLLFAVSLALSLVGTVAACDGKKDECCHKTKANQSAQLKDVTGADKELAKQAAQSMLTLTNEKPDGKISADSRKQLALDADAVKLSYKGAKQASTHGDKHSTRTGCDECESCDSCDGDCGDSCSANSCGAKTKDGLLIGGEFDGSSRTMEGKCENKGKKAPN